jgi:hypothetical protein
VSLLRGAARPEPDGQLDEITPAVCQGCGSDQFEVTATEYFCVGCCLPLGIADGEVRPSGAAWELTAPTAPSSWTRRLFRRSAAADLACPAGHQVFQVALAFTVTADGEVSHLSAALRCPDDGALHLHLDNVPVMPSGA